MPPISCNRMVGVGIGTFIVVVFLFATFHRGESPIRTIKDAAHSAASSAQNFCSNDIPNFTSSGFQNAVSHLYEAVKHPATAPNYVDASGTKFETGKEKNWQEPLGKDVLIIDMDTRAPDGKNEIFGSDTINWEKVSGKEGGSMLSASFMNHVLYAQIHGYDYKFFHSKGLKDMHNTWIKPYVLSEYLQQYKFVVFIDADATITHLEIPLEWLFNRWGVTPNTSIAMPIDTQQILNGDENASCDSKGKVTLNTGFVIAQSMPHTFEMMQAWKDCPDGKRYPNCPNWANNWSHEQRAFSEYIRYDFNPTGKNIVEIPCDDAMGYPGLHQKYPHIRDDCRGQFVRHHTIEKERTKKSTDNAMLQSLTEIMQKTLQRNKNEYWVQDGDQKKKPTKEEEKPATGEKTNSGN